MLAVHDPCVVRRLVCATAACVQDAWRLYPHVCDELRTYMCGSGSGVAVVRSAVDCVCEAADSLLQFTKYNAPSTEKQRP